MGKILLVITICSNLGCLPPMTSEKFQYKTEEQCMYKGYYAIAEVAETYMKTIGIEEFKAMQVRMLYNCISEDKWKEQMLPLEGQKSALENDA